LARNGKESSYRAALIMAMKRIREYGSRSNGNYRGSYGQGETLEEIRESLTQSIELVVQDLMDGYCRGLLEDSLKKTLIIS